MQAFVVMKLGDNQSNSFSRLSEKENTRKYSAHDSTIAGAGKTGCTSRLLSKGVYCLASCFKVNPSGMVYRLSEAHM